MSVGETVFPTLYYSFVAGRRRWQASRAPIVSPGGARAGERCRVVGRAEPLEAPLSAGYTGRPAVFYEVVERIPSAVVPGISGPDWREASREASTAPFLVVGDDGARVLVEPVIAIHIIATERVLSTSSRIRTEACIAPGETVRVFGLVDEVPTVAAAGYRGAPGTMRRLRGTIEEPIVLTRAAPGR